MILNGTSFLALSDVIQIAVPGREYPRKGRGIASKEEPLDAVDDSHCKHFEPTSERGI